MSLHRHGRHTSSSGIQGITLMLVIYRLKKASMVGSCKSHKCLLLIVCETTLKNGYIPYQTKTYSRKL